jgi:CheY-like chemotaxis protein
METSRHARPNIRAGSFMLATILQPGGGLPADWEISSHMSTLHHQPSAEPLTVLLVDDDADARIIYASYLRNQGCRVVTAADGRGALDKAAELIPDALVLDLAMPRVDGWTVLKELRASSWTTHIPVVVVTARNDARDEAFLAGCNAYLVKPCTPEVLWLQVRGLFHGQAAARAV